MAWGMPYVRGSRLDDKQLTNCQKQANVMLSYPLNEAEDLLVSKLKAAQSSLANCEEDLDFLREQITVSRSHQ